MTGRSHSRIYLELTGYTTLNMSFFYISLAWSVLLCLLVQQVFPVLVLVIWLSFLRLSAFLWIKLDRFLLWIGFCKFTHFHWLVFYLISYLIISPTLSHYIQCYPIVFYLVTYCYWHILLSCKMCSIPNRKGKLGIAFSQLLTAWTW